VGVGEPEKAQGQGHGGVIMTTQECLLLTAVWTSPEPGHTAHHGNQAQGVCRSAAKRKSKSSGRRSKSPRAKRSRGPHHSTVRAKQEREDLPGEDGGIHGPLSHQNRNTGERGTVTQSDTGPFLPEEEL
jgi:hypothetical protein